MSVDTASTIASIAALLQSTTVESLRGVLSQVAGFPITVEAESEKEFAAADAIPDEPGIWSLFTASKSLNGLMGILSTEAGALPLAQILMSEPVNTGVSL